MFFNERNRLRKEDIDIWIELHDVYSDVITVMKDLHNQGRLLIATMKDGESVKLILNKNGIDINQKNILDHSQISSKLEALNYFIAEKKIRKKDLCFIDDNVTHLIEPNEESFSVLWASWFNNLQEQRIMAKHYNIREINNQKDLITLI